MAPEPLLGVPVRRSTSLEALAALAAHVRVETEGLDADPRGRALLGEVAAELLGSTGPLDPAVGAAVVGMVRAFLRQVGDLVDNPGRAGGWTAADEALLQGIGRLSMAVTDAFPVAAGTLDGLDARLAAPGAAFLDVGTGAGWLAIAVARSRPTLHVVGIDVFEPALALARANVADAGLGDRVEVRHADVTALDGAPAYDAVWLPLPFLPEEIVPAAVAAAARVLRPGGWVLAGTFAGPDDRLSGLLVDLRTVRSGGRPWRGPDILDVITAQGLAAAAEVPRSWAAPVRLYAGRRP